VLLEKQDYNGAIDAYKIVIAKSPKKYHEAYYRKGYAHFKSQDYKKAIECYEEALKIDPNYADAWNNKGLALYKLEDRFYNLAKGLVADLKKCNEAIECYDKALEIQPKNANAWNNKGLALYQLEKYNEAIECYNKAVKLDPNYADAWYNKGNVLSHLRMYNEAIECCDKAVKINPDHELAWQSKGSCLADLGRTKELKETHDRAKQARERRWSSGIRMSEANARRLKRYLIKS
jgi:tetratricopeptide (TPR) repeat protein